jgi:hypothetical protein
MAKQFAVRFTFEGVAGQALAAVLNFSDSNSISIGGGNTIQIQNCAPSGPTVMTSFSAGEQQISLTVPAQSGQTPDWQVVVDITSTDGYLSGNFPSNLTPATLSYWILGSSENGPIPVGSFRIQLPTTAFDA